MYACACSNERVYAALVRPTKIWGNKREAEEER